VARQSGAARAMRGDGAGLWHGRVFRLHPTSVQEAVTAHEMVAKLYQFSIDSWRATTATECVWVTSSGTPPTGGAMCGRGLCGVVN